MASRPERWWLSRDRRRHPLNTKDTTALQHPKPRSLVQSNRNITAYPCRQVNLRLQIKLDPQQQRRILELAVVVDRTLYYGPCRAV